MAEKLDIHKELDLIQEVIKRMASNSFEVKKWLIGILTIILAFKKDDFLGGDPQLIWLLLVPILCFWYLDAFFLGTEKLYREIYQWVVENRSKTDIYLYDLKTTEREYPAGTKIQLKKDNQKPLRVMLNNTIWPFYVVPIVFIFIYCLTKHSQILPHVPACCCK